MKLLNKANSQQASDTDVLHRVQQLLSHHDPAAASASGPSPDRKKRATINDVELSGSEPHTPGRAPSAAPSTLGQRSALSTPSTVRGADHSDAETVGTTRSWADVAKASGSQVPPLPRQANAGRTSSKTPPKFAPVKLRPQDLAGELAPMSELKRRLIHATSGDHVAAGLYTGTPHELMSLDLDSAGVIVDLFSTVPHTSTQPVSLPCLDAHGHVRVVEVHYLRIGDNELVMEDPLRWRPTPVSDAVPAASSSDTTVLQVLVHKGAVSSTLWTAMTANPLQATREVFKSFPGIDPRALIMPFANRQRLTKDGDPDLISLNYRVRASAAPSLLDMSGLKGIGVKLASHEQHTQVQWVKREPSESGEAYVHRVRLMAEKRDKDRPGLAVSSAGSWGLRVPEGTASGTFKATGFHSHLDDSFVKTWLLNRGFVDVVMLEIFARGAKSSCWKFAAKSTPDLSAPPLVFSWLDSTSGMERTIYIERWTSSSKKRPMQSTKPKPVSYSSASGPASASTLAPQRDRKRPGDGPAEASGTGGGGDPSAASAPDASASGAPPSVPIDPSLISIGGAGQKSPMQAIASIGTLSSLGLDTHLIPGDGQCCFGAIDWFLNAKHLHSSPSMVRAEVVGEFLLHPDKWKSHWDGYDSKGQTQITWEAYCEAMRAKDTWGGDLELLAAATKWNLVFYIVRPGLATLRVGAGRSKCWLLFEKQHFDTLAAAQGNQFQKARRAHAQAITEEYTFTLEQGVLHHIAGGGPRPPVGTSPEEYTRGFSFDYKRSLAARHANGDPATARGTVDWIEILGDDICVLTAHLSDGVCILATLLNTPPLDRPNLGDTVVLHKILLDRNEHADAPADHYLCFIDHSLEVSTLVRVPRWDSKNLPALHLADLACGIGAFSLAAELCQIPVRLAVDHCPLAIDGYNAVHKGTPVATLGDLWDFRIIRMLGSLSISVITLGFPCQPWSTIGDAQGYNDAQGRGLILHALLQILFLTHIPFAILECVQGFATNREGREAFERALANMQYDIYWHMLPYQEVGPMNRVRYMATIVHMPIVALPRPNLPLGLGTDYQTDLLKGWWQHRVLIPGLLGIPFAYLTSEDVAPITLNQEEAAIYTDPKYFSNPHYRRVLDSHKTAECVLHRYGTALRTCPCGCFGPLGDRLLQDGLRSQIVDSQVDGVDRYRFLHPSEIATLLGFPWRLPFEQLPLRHWYPLLGNTIPLPLAVRQIAGLLAFLDPVRGTNANVGHLVRESQTAACPPFAPLGVGLLTQMLVIPSAARWRAALHAPLSLHPTAVATRMLHGPGQWRSRQLFYTDGNVVGDVVAIIRLTVPIPPDNRYGLQLLHLGRVIPFDTRLTTMNLHPASSLRLVWNPLRGAGLIRTRVSFGAISDPSARSSTDLAPLACSSHDIIDHRARCQCRCGCRRQPRNMHFCMSCYRRVGTGCCFAQQNPDLCHVCTAIPPPAGRRPSAQEHRLPSSGRLGCCYLLITALLFLTLLHLSGACGSGPVLSWLLPGGRGPSARSLWLANAEAGRIAAALFNKLWRILHGNGVSSTASGSTVGARRSRRASPAAASGASPSTVYGSPPRRPLGPRASLSPLASTIGSKRALKKKSAALASQASTHTLGASMPRSPPRPGGTSPPRSSHPLAAGSRDPLPRDPAASQAAPSDVQSTLGGTPQRKPSLLSRTLGATLNPRARSVASMPEVLTSLKDKRRRTLPPAPLFEDGDIAPVAPRQPPPLSVLKRPAGLRDTQSREQPLDDEHYLVPGAHLHCACGWNPKSSGGYAVVQARRHWADCPHALAKTPPTRVWSTWMGTSACQTSKAHKRYLAWRSALPEEWRRYACDLPEESSSSITTHQGATLKLHRCPRCGEDRDYGLCKIRPCKATTTCQTWVSLGYRRPETEPREGARTAAASFSAWRESLDPDDRAYVCVLRMVRGPDGNPRYGCKKCNIPPQTGTAYLMRHPCRKAKAFTRDRSALYAWLGRVNPKELELRRKRRAKDHLRRGSPNKRKPTPIPPAPDPPPAAASSVFVANC